MTEHSNQGLHQSLESFAFARFLHDYDVMWMFGAHGQNANGANNLKADEVAAVEAFMDAGGGVVATGDHESIGADMCGRISRVRLMRAWYGDGLTSTPPPTSLGQHLQEGIE